ncbi:hypothetical protein QBC38DRAFT_462118 [Podospora fimiseda]|uniref:Uncharacterized protein n=1 Tax=Podospora fimiseda TaxID=252190 RepID=A0AAN7BCM8_9PEZI|nr:hypothetical protein QBC38DRAFT_462118 [Podospora fimiseda]
MNFAAGWKEAMQPPTEPEWLAAVKKFEAAMKKHDKPRGGFNFATGEALAKASEGYSLISNAVDVMKILSMRADLEAARGCVGPVGC